AAAEAVELLQRLHGLQAQIDQRDRAGRHRVDPVRAHRIEPRHLRDERRVDRVRDVEGEQVQLVAGGVVQLARLADEAIDLALEAKQLQRLHQAEKLGVPLVGDAFEHGGQAVEEAGQIDLTGRTALRLCGRGPGGGNRERRYQEADGDGGLGSAYHAIIL